MQFTILKINRYKKFPRLIPILTLYKYLPDVWGVVLEIPQFMHGLSCLTSLVLGQQHRYTENKLINIKSAVKLRKYSWTYTCTSIWAKYKSFVFWSCITSSTKMSIWCFCVPMVFSYDEITVPNCDRGIQVVRTSFMSWNSSRLMSGGIVGCGFAVVGMNSTLDTWRLRKPSPATINPQIYIRTR